MGEGGKRGQPRWNSQNSHQLTNRKKPDHREVVSGVRRVWGTLRSASHFVVKNTIAKLANIGNPGSIQVKRKSKSTYTGKMKWWFLIRTNRPHADAGPLVRTVSGRHWVMGRQEQKERERKRAGNDTCRQKRRAMMALQLVRLATNPIARRQLLILIL